MRLWRASVWVTMALGLSVSLTADTVADPKVLFVQGGTSSTIIGGTENPQCNGAVTFCNVQIPNAISDGGANLDLDNKSGKTITEVLFYIPDKNFDQTFIAESNLFLDALIVPDIPTQIEVLFYGTGNGPPAFDSLTLTRPCSGSCLPGFKDGQNGVTPGFDFHVDVFFGTPTPRMPLSPFPYEGGLGNNEEGNLQLIATPEPGTLLLLISAVALIAGGRKLRARSTST